MKQGESSVDSQHSIRGDTISIEDSNVQKRD